MSALETAQFMLDQREYPPELGTIAPAAVSIAEELRRLADAQAEQARPSVLFRPDLVPAVGSGDGGPCWVARYGAMSAYGETPDKAMRQFDHDWTLGQGATSAGGVL